MMESLAKGESDIAVVLTQGAIAKVLDGNPSRIVKTFVESPLLWGIHVAADSDILSIDQVRGRKYAISRKGSGSHLMSIVDASERGWPSDSPQFEIVGGLEGGREALANSTAAVFFWEKFTTAPYVDSGEFRIVGERKTIWPAFVICVSEQLIRDEPDQLKQLFEVLNQQCKELSNDLEAVNLISERYKLNVTETEIWFSMTHWSEDFEMPERALTVAIEYINRLGIAQKPTATAGDVWHSLGVN
jgi:ABC-type nitrate/sulfonate/bicarbonate transport system substrate-binding protein